MKTPRGSRRQHGAPTINDVARQAGVSLMTVSRVINNDSHVRAETRKKVEEAIAALRYRPSAAARTLAGGEELRIGLLHSNPSFAYLSEFLVGLLEQASLERVHLVVEKCDADEPDTAALERLVHDRVDGVVLPPPLSDSRVLLADLHARGLPVVAVATGRAPDWVLSVSVDDAEAARVGTARLIALGHRRIGFIGGNPNQTASAERLAGYRAALDEAGIAFDPALVVPGLFTYRSGLDAAGRLLDLAQPPTAIFSSNDDMAAAAVAVAHRRGLDVPRDLSVCGFDDTALATTLWPELTTLRQPIADMSRMALRMLVAEIRARRDSGETGVRHVHVPFELIVRDSDAAPRQG